MAGEASVTQLLDQYLVEGEADLSVTQVLDQYLIQAEAPAIVVTQLVDQYLVLAITPPVITAEALSFRRVELVLTTPGEDATEHRLHRSTVSGFTPGPGNLIADSLSPSAFTYEDEGLAGGTTYYYKVVAETPDGDLPSVQVAVTTPPQLVLVVVYLEAAAFGHATDEDAVEIQYQTALASDPTFATPVDSVVLTGAPRHAYTVTGLSVGTNYLTRARIRSGPEAEWEPWSTPIAFATETLEDSTISFPARGRMISPPHGYPLRGTAAEIRWITSDEVVAVYISGDMGTTWTPIDGWTQEGIVLDTTAYPDGPYLLRVNPEAFAPLYHSGFLIDNAEVAHYVDDFFVDYQAPDRPQMAKYWEPSTLRWVLAGFGSLHGFTGHIGANKGSFGPVDPPELTACRGILFMAEVAAYGTGAGFQWDRCAAGEGLDLGIAVLGAGSTLGGDAIGVRVGMVHFLLSQAGGAPAAILASNDKYADVGVAQASSANGFRVGVGPVPGSTPSEGGWHHWEIPAAVGMSWTQMTRYGLTTKAGARHRPYCFWLWVTRPDPGGHPNRLRIRAYCDGPDAWNLNKRGQTALDETVDVVDDDNQPYVFEPGHVAFFSNKFPGNRAGDSGRFLVRYSAVLLDEVEAPLPPEPDTPSLVARACDLVLEVFDDDRETVKWSAGSTRDHETPYLVMPDRYAEQEIDVAKGAATIGTVTVAVIDKAQTPGDQDSGWMTAKLAELGLADLTGRRARLNRFVNAPTGLIPMVIIDGVAGDVRMDPSYAAFSFPIRDTREIERRIRITDTGRPTTLVPHGVYGGYGYNATDDTYLLDPAEPLLGRFVASPTLEANCGYVDLTTTPGNSFAARTIPKAIREQLFGTCVVEDGSPFAPRAYHTTFRGLAVLWRAQGSSDPWTEIGETLVLDGTKTFLNDAHASLVDTVTAFGDPDSRAVVLIRFGDSRATPQIPAYNQDIEILVISRKPASEDVPLYLEGLTAGEVARNVYDGLYSPRDENDQVVPTGIRYDEAALLQMMDPVRGRITEPITDARTWLEKVIYAPTGWVPALDEAGRISPVSQIPPASVEGLPIVNNAVTEPSPDWGSGQRIINVIRFTYARDYIPTDPGIEVATDGLATQPVIMEFRDEPSITRNGEQVLELDGSCFRALGDENGDALEGVTSDETGFQLFQDRRLYVGNRYSLGAPIVTVNVMREPLIELRAGSWVRIDLSWFPDYVTGRRGLVALGQVIGIADLDCAWRRLTMEQVLLIDLGS